MTNREPAASRSQNSSSHPSIEVAAPWIRRIAGSAGSPKVWTQRSTPWARTTLSLDPVGRISESGVGSRSLLLLVILDLHSNVVVLCFRAIVSVVADAALRN